MRAARFNQTGDLSYLHVADVDTPEPDDTQVLVRIAASGINPSDVKNVQGKMGHTTLPRTPGRDFAGTVMRGPTGLVGKEVWGSGGELGFTRDGAHAEHLLLPRDGVSLKPTSLTLEEAATVGVPFITAWSALVEAGQITAGDRAAILGAAGAVGSAAVQIARWRGAHVIGVVRDEGQGRAVTDLGARAVVNTAPETLPDAVRGVTDGRGATLILDTVGGPMLEASLKSLAGGGRTVAITTTQPRVEIDLLDFYRRELTLRGVNTLSLDAAAGARILSSLAPGFESGDLRPPRIAARYGLEHVADAYAAVAKGGSGKTLLTP